MLLIGTRNTASQDLDVGELVNIGSVYRKYCKKDCGVNTFNSDSTSITLNRSGFYHITATAIVAGTAAGTATLQLFSNGIAIPGAISSETITTADTELRTMVIDIYVAVDSTCILGNLSTLSQVITLVNTGIATTISNVVINIDKVL